MEENISEICRSLKITPISDKLFEEIVNIEEQVASTATHKALISQILFEDLETGDMPWDTK